MSKKEIPAKSGLAITTVKPYVCHEARKSCFTEGEVWASVPANTDQLQLFFGDVEKSYQGFVRVGKELAYQMKLYDGGMLHLRPDGSVWVRKTNRMYDGSFVYRITDGDNEELGAIGTWRIELFSEPNEDNEFGTVFVQNTKTKTEFKMMCKHIVKNNVSCYDLRPPYPDAETAAKWNAERKAREARKAEAKTQIRVAV